MNGEQLTWFKSSYSSGEGGECLEVAYGTDVVHLRDSKTPETPHLTLAPSTWAAFIAAHQ